MFIYSSPLFSYLFSPLNSSIRISIFHNFHDKGFIICAYDVDVMKWRVQGIQIRSTCSAFRPDVGPIQPPIPRVLGVLSLEVKRLERETSLLRLVPRTRMVELFFHSSIRLHATMFNFIIKDRDIFLFLPLL